MKNFKNAIIECVPNFSEGRNMDVIKQITSEIEKIEGVRLNLKKDATKMKLKKVLETAVWAWNAKQPVKESQSLAGLVSGQN